jgi:hypothetical protein
MALPAGAELPSEGNHSFIPQGTAGYLIACDLEWIMPCVCQCLSPHAIPVGHATDILEAL